MLAAAVLAVLLEELQAERTTETLREYLPLRFRSAGEEVPVDAAVLAIFPVVVWSWDELVRWHMRRRDPVENHRAGSGAAYGQS